MLTAKQREVLDIIIACQENHNFTPSQREIGNMVRINAFSGIHRILEELGQRGYIRRLPNCARAIEVLRKPDGAIGYTPLLQSHRRLLKALKSIVGEPNDGAIPPVTHKHLTDAWAAIDEAPEEK